MRPSKLWYCNALQTYPKEGHCSDISRLIHPDRHVGCGYRTYTVVKKRGRT